jgi:hypothetical protein
MTTNNDNLDAPEIPKFERAGFQLPDFELEEGEIHYVDLSDEYFEFSEPDSSLG